jgi:hypothetical protein
MTRSLETMAAGQRATKPGGVYGSPRVWVWLLSVVGLLASAEALARFGIGLGDPPLSDAYPDLEYAFRPGTYRRFGNRIHINAHHMRSPEFSARKQTPHEFRVMLMGDSVINGGALTDQDALASEMLRRELESQLGVPVVVGNISAGSWGPGNLLAYAQRFGFFDADVIVIVLNSEDASDNPTGAMIVGIDPSFPNQKPLSALTEGLARYVAPRLLRSAAKQDEPLNRANNVAAEIEQAMRDLGMLCDMALAAGAKVLLVHFPNRAEVAGDMLDGYRLIASFAVGRGLELVELKAALAASSANGTDPYRPRDPIHPNEIGQRIIAEQLVPSVVAAAAVE